MVGASHLYFYDAVSPIVLAETIDMSKVFRASRWGRSLRGAGAGTGAADSTSTLPMESVPSANSACGVDDGDGDYLNCPFTADEYARFYAALMAAERAPLHEFDQPKFFEGCLPIEVMAERGRETLRHGPMKPVGLTNPHDPSVKAYAIVQLRQDNKLGTLYNMVGFQTKLKHGEQTRIFRTIPGLERAEFARLGGLHRNTFLNSPKLLDDALRLKSLPRLRFAGQITGCEGYVESAAIGLLAGRFAAAERCGEALEVPPPTTAHGALLAHITGGHVETIDAGPRSFQPMNVNFGLFPPLAKSPSRRADGTRLRGTEKTLAKRRALTARALHDLDNWSRGLPVTAAAGAGLVPAGESDDLPEGLPEPHLR